MMNKLALLENQFFRDEVQAAQRAGHRNTLVCMRIVGTAGCQVFANAECSNSPKK
jgi:hypothetical protein